MGEVTGRDHIHALLLAPLFDGRNFELFRTGARVFGMDMEIGDVTHKMTSIIVLYRITFFVKKK